MSSRTPATPAAPEPTNPAAKAAAPPSKVDWVKLVDAAVAEKFGITSDPASTPALKPTVPATVQAGPPMASKVAKACALFEAKPPLTFAKKIEKQSLETLRKLDCMTHVAHGSFAIPKTPEQIKAEQDAYDAMKQAALDAQQKKHEEELKKLREENEKRDEELEKLRKEKTLEHATAKVPKKPAKASADEVKGANKAFATAKEQVQQAENDLKKKNAELQRATTKQPKPSTAAQADEDEISTLKADASAAKAKHIAAKDAAAQAEDPKTIAERNKISQTEDVDFWAANERPPKLNPLPTTKPAQTQAAAEGDHPTNRTPANKGHFTKPATTTKPPTNRTPANGGRVYEKRHQHGTGKPRGNATGTTHFYGIPKNLPRHDKHDDNPWFLKAERFLDGDEQKVGFAQSLTTLMANQLGNADLANMIAKLSNEHFGRLFTEAEFPALPNRTIKEDPPVPAAPAVAPTASVSTPVPAAEPATPASVPLLVFDDRQLGGQLLECIADVKGLTVEKVFALVVDTPLEPIFKAVAEMIEKEDCTSQKVLIAQDRAAKGPYRFNITPLLQHESCGFKLKKDSKIKDKLYGSVMAQMIAELEKEEETEKAKGVEGDKNAASAVAWRLILTVLRKTSEHEDPESLQEAVNDVLKTCSLFGENGGIATVKEVTERDPPSKNHKMSVMSSKIRFGKKWQGTTAVTAFNNVDVYLALSLLKDSSRLPQSFIDIINVAIGRFKRYCALADRKHEVRPTLYDILIWYFIAQIYKGSPIILATAIPQYFTIETESISEEFRQAAVEINRRLFGNSEDRTIFIVSGFQGSYFLKLDGQMYPLGSYAFKKAGKAVSIAPLGFRQNFTAAALEEYERKEQARPDDDGVSIATTAKSHFGGPKPNGGIRSACLIKLCTPNASAIRPAHNYALVITTALIMYFGGATATAYLGQY